MREYVNFVAEELRRLNFSGKMIELFVREASVARTPVEVNERLVQLGLMDAEQAARLLAKYCNVEFYDYFGEPSPVAVELTRTYLGPEVSTQAQCMIVSKNADNGKEVFKVAFVWPERGTTQYMAVTESLRRSCRGKAVEVIPLCISLPAMEHFSFFAFNNISTEDLGLEVNKLEKDSEMPPDRLIQMLIAKAVYENVSDIHFEPSGTGGMGRVRARKDGLLTTWCIMSLSLYSRVVRRLKILAGVQAEATRFKPADGNFANAEKAFLAALAAEFGVSGVDYRLSFYPNQIVAEGEDYDNSSCVIRILNRRAGVPSLTALGFQDVVTRRLAFYASKAYGMFVITGPTGSGKTTTLYSMMRMVDAAKFAVVTVEDPIEYSHPLWKQGQVREGFLTFENALPSILRHDPDVVLLGEIRDETTAEYAIRAANTGHLLLTTLHANDAPQAVIRLLDLNVRKYFIESTVFAILSQRLVRKVCPYCMEEVEVAEEEREKLRYTLANTYRIPEDYWRESVGSLKTQVVGRGCDRCDNSGFLGRMAIGELLEMNSSEVVELIENDRFFELRSAMLKLYPENALPLDGLRRVKDKKTSLAEVFRVCA